MDERVNGTTTKKNYNCNQESLQVYIKICDNKWRVSLKLRAPERICFRIRSVNIIMAFVLIMTVLNVIGTVVPRHIDRW